MSASNRRNLLVHALLAGAFLCVAAWAQSTPNPVRYSVSLGRAGEHLLRVRMEIPGSGAFQDVQLPVWNALYQVRDFAQYIRWIRAADPQGKPLAVEKVDKCTWRIRPWVDGAAVEYEIYADQAGPFGAQLNLRHAFLNLAEVLLYPVTGKSSASVLGFTEVPAGWRVATALPSAGSNEFSAGRYDQLADSPVEMGSFEEADFDQSGSHYRVIVDAERDDYRLEKITASLKKIVAAATGWMDDRPFETYLFIYHFPRGPAGGGMEHAYSTAIDVSAEVLASHPETLEAISAHEFFHLWNVKRIRPQTLEPVDYTRENYTRALWFSEGATSAAGAIILNRGGLQTEAAYLAELGSQIAELERRPARLTQSAEEASLDAWLERYAAYRSPERSISYYNKGFLLGVLLDLAVRKASHDSASLRDVFQWMNLNYARQGIFFPDSDGVRRAAEAVSHAGLSWFFEKYVAGTAAIPWDEFFEPVGLRVVQQKATAADPGFTAEINFDPPPAVLAVRSGSPAEQAGLRAGDVILTINGRAASSDFRSQMESLNPGDTIRLRVARGKKESDLEWRLSSREEVEHALKDLERVTEGQRARRAAWLKGESLPSGGARP